MFNIGFFELLILGVIALFFVGPKDLPKLARYLVSCMNELKRTRSHLIRSLDSMEAIDLAGVEKMQENGKIKNKDKETKIEKSKAVLDSTIKKKEKTKLNGSENQIYP